MKRKRKKEEEKETMNHILFLRNQQLIDRNQC